MIQQGSVETRDWHILSEQYLSSKINYKKQNFLNSNIYTHQSNITMELPVFVGFMGNRIPLFDGTSTELFGVVLLALCVVAGGGVDAIGSFIFGLALHGLRAILRKSLGINGLRNFLKLNVRKY